MNSNQFKYNCSDSAYSSVPACPGIGIKQLMIKQIKPVLARE